MARKNVTTKSIGVSVVREPEVIPDEVEEVVLEETSLEIDDDEEILTPIPVKATPVPSKRPRRDLGGVYTCKTCVRHGGVKHSPGTELQLTDAEARHYLKFNSVVALD